MRTPILGTPSLRATEVAAARRGCYPRNTRRGIHGQPSRLSSHHRHCRCRRVHRQELRHRGRPRRQRASRRPFRRRRRAGRVLLARDPAGVHAGSHDDQPEQRQQLPQPACRPRGAQTLSRFLQPVACLPSRAPRTEPRDGSPPPCRGVRLRRRGIGGDAQLERSAPDRAERHRSQGGRRGPDYRAGLRAHAHDLGSADAAREDQGHADQLPGADDAGRSLSALREGDHAADQSAALLPHHESHWTAVSGAAARAPGTAARHPDGGRRRACRGPLPVQAARSRNGLLRHEPAQVAAGAAQHGVPVRSQRPRSRRPGRCRRRRRAATTTSGNSRRSARSPPRPTRPSTRRSHFTRRSASSERRRGCGFSPCAGSTS